MMQDTESDKETAGKSMPSDPAPETPTQPVAKKEIVRNPEEQEKLRAAVFEVAMAKRGRDQDPVEAEQVSNILTEQSIKTAESLGLEVPAEYMSEVQGLLNIVNNREQTGLTMIDDTLRVIRENDDPRALYAAMVAITRSFGQRDGIEAPPAEEIREFVELVSKIKTGAVGDDDPHQRLEEFERIMFDVNEIREGKLETEVYPADSLEEMLTGQIASIIESVEGGAPGGVQSITTESIIPQYVKGKKSSAPWHKVPREMQTQIRAGMHAAVKHFPGSQVQIEDFGGEGKNDIGPVITFKKQEG